MSGRGTTVRLATRGSDLALRQAGAVKAALEERRYEVELVEVETTGDRVRDELIHRLGKTGAFVRSLDEKVIEGTVDGAVHSMKDMPTESPEELVVAVVPERAPAADLLVTPDGRSLADLPEGAAVGTSSLRRGAQLRRERPDLEIVPLRGNVDTRVEKLLVPSLQREHERRLEAAGELEEDAAGESDGDEDGAADADDDGFEDDGVEDADSDDADGDESDADGDESDADHAPSFDRTPAEWFDDLAEIERRALEREVETEYDAVVLAEAGLERSGLLPHLSYHRLPVETFVPSPGQGAVAVTMLDSDLAESVHDVLDHPRTRVETTVERVTLAELGGGCVAPLGVHARIRGEHVHVRGQALSRDGERVVEGTRDLPVEDYVGPTRAFAADLAERGAAELIDEARADAEDREAKRGDA